MPAGDAGSNILSTGTPQIKLVTNRLVILDDPAGWDGGNKTIPITDVATSGREKAPQSGGMCF